MWVGLGGSGPMWVGLASVPLFPPHLRRLMQIDVETKRTMNIPFLTSTEREAIMREKYMATMKPVSQLSLSSHTVNDEGCTEHVHVPMK